MFAATAFAPARAEPGGGAVALTPVRLELSAAKPIGLLEIANPGRDAAMQLRAFRWSQADGEDVLAPTDDLIVNPPMFLLGSGARQLVRVGLRRPAPGGRELTYRLLIDQIPEPPEPGAARLSLPIRLSAPVFITAEGLPPPALSWRLEQASGQPHLVVANSGARHARLDGLELTRGGIARRRAGPVYLLPGSARAFPLDPALLPQPGSPLHVSAIMGENRVEEELEAGSGASRRALPAKPGG